MTFKTPFIGGLIGLVCGPGLGFFLNFIGNGSIISEIGYVYLLILLGIFSKITSSMEFVSKDAGTFFTLGIGFYVFVGATIATAVHYLGQLGYRWNFGMEGLDKTKTNVK